MDDQGTVVLFYAGTRHAYVVSKRNDQPEANPPSCLVGLRRSSPGVKQPGC